MLIVLYVEKVQGVKRAQHGLADLVSFKNLKFVREEDCVHWELSGQTY